MVPFHISGIEEWVKPTSVRHRLSSWETLSQASGPRSAPGFISIRFEFQRVLRCVFCDVFILFSDEIEICELMHKYGARDNC